MSNDNQLRIRRRSMSPAPGRLLLAMDPALGLPHPRTPRWHTILLSLRQSLLSLSKTLSKSPVPLILSLHPTPPCQCPPPETCSLPQRRSNTQSRQSTAMRWRNVSVSMALTTPVACSSIGRKECQPGCAHLSRIPPSTLLTQNVAQALGLPRSTLRSSSKWIWRI